MLIRTNRPHMITCEGSTFIHKETGYCRIIKTEKRSKVIKLNERSFYINNFVDLTIVWGCPGFAKVININESVWITLDWGCYMNLLNQTFSAPGYLGEHQIELNLVDKIPGIVEFESIPIKSIQNHTKIALSAANQFDNLNRKIGDQIISTNRKITHSQLAPGPDIENILYLILAIIISTMLVILILRCFLR